ncbi:MAG: hypothetical protein QXT77_09465 [Candidatus Methanomethylicaceae archaeon]
MSTNWHLYPSRKVVGQDYTNVKKIVVPNQSMTLKEILRRFVRRESLPVEKQGMYAEGFGDLEKMMHEDFTVQEERINELKKKVADAKEKEDASAKADAQAKAKPKADPSAREADPSQAGSGVDQGEPAGQADGPKPT